MKGWRLREWIRHNTRWPRVHNLTDSSYTRRKATSSRAEVCRDCWVLPRCFIIMFRSGVTLSPAARIVGSCIVLCMPSRPAPSVSSGVQCSRGASFCQHDTKGGGCCRVGGGTKGGSGGRAKFAAACLALEDSLTHDQWRKQFLRIFDPELIGINLFIKTAPRNFENVTLVARRREHFRGFLAIFLVAQLPPNRGVLVHKNSLASCQRYRHSVEPRALTCPFKQSNLSARSRQNCRL